MSRIRLIHWNAAEAEERAAQLASAGHDVVHEALRDASSLRALARRPPEAVVIDLSRLPMQGRDLGLWLRKQKATRHVPLVFVDGDPAKVARAREHLPDAVYASWRGIRSALRRAVARPPAEPVVPRSTLAGYSGTPLPRKLGIKPGAAVALLGAPRGFERTLGALPAGARLRRGLRGRHDLILWFVPARAELTRRATDLAGRLGAGRLWICWRKQTSGAATDLNERRVREAGLAAGLVDYKIAALDGTWSGLLFTRRRRLRR
jgi:CheY-like chemotaxis protein